QFPDGTPATPLDGGVSTDGSVDASPSDAASSDGGIDATLPDAAATSDAASPIDASSPTAPTGPTGRSTITFRSLFNGDVDESSAELRLNEGSFDVYLADPREICPGGLGPPPPCRGHLKGGFKFYFERGRPAQPFP